jgi:hypothetical protein
VTRSEPGADRAGRTRRGRRTPRRLAVLALAALVALTGCSPPLDPLVEAALERPLPAPAGGAPSQERARRVLGEPRSQQPWLSGVWAGGDVGTGARVEAFGAWRGTPVDAVTMYPAYRTWEEIEASTWHIETYADTPAVLVYGLPMLPSNGEGSFASILAGEHDAVYAKVARDLVTRGRGSSVVRIGLEANGDWFPWNATADTAPAFRAAFRHVVSVLRAEAPELVIDFDIACGTQLRGQRGRTDALELLYPGDDAVDLVGCDAYDWYHTASRDQQSWERTLRPTSSVGLADVADFARSRGKGMSVPEWGLASPEEEGLGDNPYFITQVRGFFEANSDVLVLEGYFSEPETSLASSIWDPDQNPRSSEVYARLW